MAASTGNRDAFNAFNAAIPATPSATIDSSSDLITGLTPVAVRTSDGITANPWLATKVAAVQFVLSENAVICEIDVIGSAVAVPEAATLSLITAGAMTLLRRRH